MSTWICFTPRIPFFQTSKNLDKQRMQGPTFWACNFSSRPLKLIRNGVPKNISPAAAGAALLKAQNWWRDDIFLTPVTVLHKNIIWLYTARDRLHQAHLLKSPAFSVCLKKLAPFFGMHKRLKLFNLRLCLLPQFQAGKKSMRAKGHL